MPDEEVKETEAAEEAESQETQAAGEETVQETGSTESQAAETEVTETTTTELAPKTFTEAEVQVQIAKARADLESKWTPKLQESAHQAQVLKALQAVADRLDGKKPEDPNALPEGFELLPEPVQKRFLEQDKALKTIQEQQRQLAKQNMDNSIDGVVSKFRKDEKNGKLFQSLEDDIANEIKASPRKQQWLAEDPGDCIETLFLKHAKRKESEVAVQAATTKAIAAVKASSRPSSMTTTQTTQRAVLGQGEDPFEAAWKMHGSAVLEAQGAE